MADTVRGVHALQQELAKAKESLNAVDENIKKLTGRDPGDNRPPSGTRRVVIGGGAPAGGGGGLGLGGGPSGRGETRGTERNFTINRRSLSMDDGSGPPAKRRALGGAFSRLGPRVGGARPRPEPQGRDSGDEEEAPDKHTVQSSVVPAPKDSRTRQDSIREQSKDSEGTARNRRMFGLLLGTLQRFQRDAKDTGDKEKQRQVIEQKLEERAAQEKEDIRIQRQTLYHERKSKQEKVKKIEHKMELAEIHEEWESQTKRLMNFIRTKAKPPLFYLPKTHTPATEKKLKETGKVLEDIITKRRRQLEEEIEELTAGDEKLMHRESRDMEEPMEESENGKNEEEEQPEQRIVRHEEPLETKDAAASKDPVQDEREVELKDRKSADKENRKEERGHRRRDSGKKEESKRRESRGGSGERDGNREGRSGRDRSRSDRDRSRSDKHKEKSKHDSHESSRRKSRDRKSEDRSRRERRRSRRSSERSEKAGSRDKKEKEKEKKKESPEKIELPKEKAPEMPEPTNNKAEDLGEIRMDIMPDLDSIALPSEPLPPAKKEEVIEIKHEEEKVVDQKPTEEAVIEVKDDNEAGEKPETAVEGMTKESPIVVEDPKEEAKQADEAKVEENKKGKEKKKKQDDEDEESDEDSDSDSSSSSSSSSSGSSSSSSGSSSSDSDEEDEKPKKSSRKSESSKKSSSHSRSNREKSKS